MNKKAQGMSINVIIVAAIALLVLVILSVIFIGKIGIFSETVGDCESKGGSCVLASESCPSEFPQKYSPWSCPQSGEDDQQCCIKIG